MMMTDVENSTLSDSCEPTPGLRYVERDGVLVLQQYWRTMEYYDGKPLEVYGSWRDVPVHDIKSKEQG